MTFSRGILLVVATTCLSVALVARLMPHYSYQQLLDKSDLVVIATPTTKTADTKERSFFNLSIVEPNGKQTPIPSIGVETKFDIEVVLKGKPLVGKIVLHHFREGPHRLTATGPGPLVISFDPSDIQHRRSYLLFLVREADGRYGPTAGPDRRVVLNLRTPI
jgi:hypothetical protein